MNSNTFGREYRTLREVNRNSQLGEIQSEVDVHSGNTSGILLLWYTQNIFAVNAVLI